MQPLIGNQTYVSAEGRDVLTLRDILPESATQGLRVLFVAKTPTPFSVSVGHYFQGRHGTNFLSRLKHYGLLTPTTTFEDDSLLAQGFGLTDIVKVPRAFSIEPTAKEYREGVPRILELIHLHQPKGVTFVYKTALGKMTNLYFSRKKQSRYGFNQELEVDFGARIFAFRLPGVGGKLCNKAIAESAMDELCDCLRGGPGVPQPDE